MRTGNWITYAALQQSFLSRRSFLAASGAALALAGAGNFAKPAFAEPKQGGHLRHAMSTGSSTDTLDPATYADNYAVNALWGAWSNSLCVVDIDGSAVGDLAESFESSADFKTWNFKLRPGLQFHDGKSVTPDDVVASIRHHMGENSKSIAKSMVKQIEDVKADGPNAVTFTLKGGRSSSSWNTITRFGVTL